MLTSRVSEEACIMVGGETTGARSSTLFPDNSEKLLNSNAGQGRLLYNDLSGPTSQAGRVAVMAPEFAPQGTAEHWGRAEN